MLYVMVDTTVVPNDLQFAPSSFASKREMEVLRRLKNVDVSVLQETESWKAVEVILVPNGIRN